MDCSHIEELLSGYALNALDEAEAAGVEEHIDSCPWCTAILRDHVETLTLLAQAAEAAVPPDMLKSRVLASIPQRPRRERTPAGISGGRFSASYLAMGAAASVVIVALAAFIGVAIGMSNKIDDLEEDNSGLSAQVAAMAQTEEKLVEMSQEQRSISYAMAAPDSEVVPLQVTEESPTARALLLISPHDGTAILMAFGLKPSTSGEDYHVWLRSGDLLSLMGSLRVDETGWGILTLWPDKPMKYFQRISVTREAAEQTSSITDGRPVLWGTIDID